MLKRHSEFFKSLLFLVDMALIGLAWIGAYYLRFHGGVIPVTKGVPPVGPYLSMFGPIIAIWAVAFKAFELYRPRRISSRRRELWDVTKACGLATLVAVALTFFLRQFEYSRAVFLLFFGLSVGLVTANRWAFREVLRFFRRRGYNQRHVLVVGSGALAGDLAARLERRHELGLRVVGCVVRERGGEREGEPPVLGTYDELPEVLSRYAVDQVFLALPHADYAALTGLLAHLRDQMADIRIVPDIREFVTIRGEAEIFEGLPIVTLQASPLHGWNRVAKRAMDVGFSIAILGAASPLLLLVALLVKLSSPGPVLYRQRRMGYDGRVFEMLKFRSMREDAERHTGAVWATRDDPRRTAIGAWLRRTSLDELPQFLNVIRGEMSIVGPRPERPELVERFRTMIPRYMLRHKIKAGITGWAQVNGWRGDTSLEERVRCDLEYIQKWSIALDLKIMLLTVVRGLYHKNAY